MSVLTNGKSSRHGATQNHKILRKKNADIDIEKKTAQPIIIPAILLGFRLKNLIRKILNKC